jgi:hydroxyethylthiazole kinase
MKTEGPGIREEGFAAKTVEILREIRKRRPLIHHITNFVVMNTTANVTLAVGASPIMAHAHDEMEEISGFSDALNLNIGTLTPRWVESMILAGRVAGAKGTPIIFDPVGAGATSLRSESSARILAVLPVTVVRGNASEILSLVQDKEDVKIKGVDSLESVDAVRDSAHRLAGKLRKVIAVTGEVDFVTDGTRALEVHNGHPMFSHVTGTGCAATAVVSCFNAVEPDALTATAAALAYYGLAGEEAAMVSQGPGSFQVTLYDMLYGLPEKVMLERLRINQVS